LDGVPAASLKFEDFLGEIDVIGSQYDKRKTQQDPTLADIRNFAIEFGVLPLGTSSIRSKICPIPSICFYGPPGSGKTKLSRSIAHSCGARWFDLSPARICDTGLTNTKKDLEMIVTLTFDVARYLKPAVIYIDEIERLFEGGKQTICHPSMMLDTLKAQMKSKCTEKGRILIIGNTNKPWLIKDRKAFKAFFTSRSEKQKLRYMCYCPYPNYANRVLLWREFIAQTLKKHKIDLIDIETHNDLDIELLAKCSEGYTAGDIKASILELLTTRRVRQYKNFDKHFTTEEFLFNLSKIHFTYDSDYKNISIFTAEMTCREAGMKAIEDAEKAKLEGEEEASKNKKKKK